MMSTPVSLLRTVREVAKESGRIKLTRHARERMAQRGISFSQVLHCLRTGRIDEGPAKNVHGDWAFRMVGTAAGEAIQVAAALATDGRGNRIIVITAY